MHRRDRHETLLKTFIIALTGPCGVNKGDPVLVCVSGGRDSMVLLDLMHSACRPLDLKLGVIHVDHGLRKGESAQDARFVQERCRGLSVRFHLVELKMTPDRANVEEEARTRRYDVIHACMQNHGYAFAATGHTLDDQAETILYRIIRGTGIRGLAGMEFMRPDGIIRPMLGIKRGHVAEYARLQGITYVNDRTNDDTRLARNHIRTDIIPLLERINPQAVRSIASLANIAREEGSALEEMALDLEQGSIVFDWVMIKAFRAEDVRAAPDAVIKRFLIHIISGFINDPRGIDAIQIDAALEVLKGTLRAHSIKRKVKVLLEGDLFIVHLTSPGPHYVRKITNQDSIFIPEINKTVHIGISRGIAQTCLLRSYMRGDRMMGKKLSSTLARMKIPCALRPFWPVFEAHKEIIAVAAFEKTPASHQMVLEEHHGK
jgi:tRNA(Ile)-lysidine synthetase-like protein